MHAETVPLAERQHLIQRVYRANGRRSQSHHHCAHIAFAQFSFQRIHTHAPAMVRGNGRIIQLQHRGDALVSVVRLLRADNAFARRQLPGHP